jgi:hypothetical protein
MYIQRTSVGDPPFSGGTIAVPFGEAPIASIDPDDIGSGAVMALGHKHPKPARGAHGGASHMSFTAYLRLLGL